MLAGQSEQRLEGRHRRPSSVEAEHVLVKVVLQVLLTHAVVCSRQPSLEIRKHPVHSWEEFGGVRPVPLGLTVVFIASVPKGTVAAPAICMHDASGGHRLLDEAHQRRGRQIFNDAEPDPAGAAATDLDSSDHDRLRALT